MIIIRLATVILMALHLQQSISTKIGLMKTDPSSRRMEEVSKSTDSDSQQPSEEHAMFQHQFSSLTPKPEGYVFVKDQPKGKSGTNSDDSSQTPKKEQQLDGIWHFYFILMIFGTIFGMNLLQKQQQRANLQQRGQPKGIRLDSHQEDFQETKR